MQRSFLSSLFVTASLSLIACGGGDDDSDPTPTSGTGSGDVGSSGGTASGNAGELTLTTESGQATVEADGETVVFRKAESRHYSCDIGENSISINFASDDGRELLINGQRLDGRWNVIAYAEGAGNDAIKYEVRVPENADSFGLEGMALSIQGNAAQYRGFDLASDERVPATIAVNCTDPGG